MSTYALPILEQTKSVAANEVLLIASGDLRQSANQVCWPAQVQMEKQLTEAFEIEGIHLRRAHPYQADLKHGFIYNQRMGMDVFARIHPEAPLVIAEAVWQIADQALATKAAMMAEMGMDVHLCGN